MSGAIRQTDRARRVSVRMVNSADEVDLMDLDIVPISRDCEKIQYQHEVVGYIEHVGHIFVALCGSRLDRAEECGQCLLWDQAAAELMRQAKTCRAARVAGAA